MKPVLIVVSQQSGKGPTGVETHFNLIIQSAQQFGVETLLIEPYIATPLFYKLRSRLLRVLGYFSKEQDVLWDIRFSTKLLEKRLSKALNKLDGRQVVMYTQDPHSVKAALAARKNPTNQIVSVVHYNVSEANEMAVNGLTSDGGALWNEMMSTEKEVLPMVDKLIFVSEFMQRTVNNRLKNIITKPQLVIPNFPALPKLDAENYSLVSGDIIAIGTLEPRKNQSFILHVLAECKGLGKIYKLTIVGDGPDRAGLELLSTKLGVAEQVNFLGFQKDASQFIAAHRALVHAAHMESFGIVLTEAMSYKRPVLAAPVGGIPEVLTDGKEGRYWNLESALHSAKILISILDDSKKWQMMSEQAGYTFCNRFHPDIVGKRWLDALLKN